MAGMKKVLITGAAGFIGYHMARTLADRETEVFVADDFSRGEADPLYEELTARSNVHRVDANLAEQASVAALPLDMDVVFHLAALNGTQNFYERPRDVLWSNTLPTMWLTEHYAQAKNLQRFVYAGTSEAYASMVTLFDWPVPTAEDVPLGIADNVNPRWSYAISKLHGEVVVAQVMRAAGLPYTVIRYHNAYGPRMGDKHVVPDFLERCRKQVYELYGSEDTRAFMYIDDAIEATLSVAASEKLANDTVNIGSVREIRILDLARLILAQAEVEAEIDCHEAPAGSVKRRVPDVSKLREATGFKERWSLEDGLRETMKFYCPELLKA